MSWSSCSSRLKPCGWRPPRPGPSRRWRDDLSLPGIRGDGGPDRGLRALPDRPGPLGALRARRAGTAPEDALIIGGGPAADGAAAGLREAGFSGRITLVSDEQSPPYERPPLSKGFLAGAVSPDELPL